MPIRARLLLTTAIVAVALIPVYASSPKFFQAATQSDFLKGDVDNLSIDAHGQLTLGPVTELVYETSAPFLWSMVAAPDGSLFIGTGNEGKVFRVDAQGKGSMFFDSAELEAHALALAPNGGIYVGTSPDGKIYKVDRNGTATTFFSASSSRGAAAIAAACAPGPRMPAHSLAAAVMAATVALGMAPGSPRAAS